MADKFGRGSEILDALKAMTLSAPYSGSGGSSSGATIAGTGLANTIPYWNDVATLGYIANAAGYLSNDGAGAFSWVATPPPAAHNILSASHGDTTAAAIQRGDLLTGQGASPHLARLGKESQYTFLGMGANEPAWSTGLLIWPTPASMSALLTGADLTGVRFAGGPAAGSLELKFPVGASDKVSFLANASTTLYVGVNSSDPLGIIAWNGGSHFCGIRGGGQIYLEPPTATDLDIHFPSGAIIDIGSFYFESLGAWPNNIGFRMGNPSYAWTTVNGPGTLTLGGYTVTVTADCSIPGGAGGLTQAQALALVCLRG